MHQVLLIILGFITLSFLSACGDNSSTENQDIAETPTDLMDYQIRCQEGGVPRPPDWGSPDWTPRGRLETSFITPDDRNIVVSIFSFESQNPAGLCVALSRGRADIANIGIICQGQQTGNACFWDTTGLSISGQRAIEDFFSADEIEVEYACTVCHQGANAFLIHPGSILDLGPLTQSDVWYTPIVPETWPSNPEPSTQLLDIELEPGNSSCLSCHNSSQQSALPTITAESYDFCTNVLLPAMRLTMPTDDPSDVSYRQHKEHLQDLCSQTVNPSQATEVNTP